MKGCAPSLGVGMKKLTKKRFQVKEVAEFRTSKLCNGCFCKLEKRDGKLSYSRLCCSNCAGRHKNRCKQFVDRDLNAAANILLVGSSRERPPEFCRQLPYQAPKKRKRKLAEESPGDPAKRTRLSVDAERTLSDPASEGAHISSLTQMCVYSS